ncbi:hypothetical protein [Paenibacillus sp. Soil522]|uniref:hypothetical protein n=1 Tax=Paenibacillus sp. Soil522 TaxID=1736388 RepID=UPI0006FC6655|nr:hypothetical protein [Paenibacillus sp. Soil522]KRE46291.1 hypothetical protein ASG81_11845 [Paenibacillus sp. Soil522]
MIFGTVTSASDLPKAMIMARSVKKYMPRSKVVVGIIEDKIPESALRFPYFNEVILMKHITTYTIYYKFFFQYTLQEAIRSCKAPIMKYIYYKYTDEDIMVYLDADMKVLGPFDELPAIVKENPITVTGHFIYPETFDPDGMAEIRKLGLLHPGIVALNRHPSAEKYLLWWSKISDHHGYYDHEKNRFADQDWLDLSHLFFDEVYTLRHAGYNVSSLNLIERWNIDRIGEDLYVINDQPLRCLQLSPDLLLASSWIEPEKGKIYSDLYIQYLNHVIELGLSDMDKKPWSYSLFSSGEPISDETKRIFLKNYMKNPEIENPFMLSNAYFNIELDSQKTDIIPNPHLPQKIIQKQNKAIQISRTKARRVKINASRKKRIRRSG